MRPYTGKMREVRKVAPPHLEQVHVHEKVFTHRPVRKGGPNMSVEQKEGKVVAHHYGHKNGWTLAPSGATYVNGMLLDSDYSQGLGTDTPITILGADIVALFTAYDLVQRGFQNITVISDESDTIPAHHPGTILGPVFLGSNSEMQRIVGGITADTYAFFASIAKRKNPDFTEGATFMTAYFENREGSGLEPYVGNGMEEPKEVTLDFGNGTKRDMVAYDDAIYIDTVKLMEGLRQHLKGKVIFVNKKVASLAEVHDTFIIDCTGLVSGERDNPQVMMSAQGHLLMLRNQNPAEMNYMITAGHGSDGAPGSFYLCPKQMPGAAPTDSGVIGGKCRPGVPASGAEHALLLKGAKEFFGIK